MSPYRARAAAGAAIILGLQAMAVPALAHHGWGSYDSTTVTTLEGYRPIRILRQPACPIQLNSQGKVWFIVLAPPSRMSSRGLPDGTLKAGQAVSLDGYIHKSDPVELRAERIRVDGKSVELR
jgi:hypothetical protein